MDREAVKAFMNQFGLMSTHAGVIGVMAVCDRVGLFSQMALSGPATADELASAAGLEPRYVEEALAALAAAEMAIYTEADGTFALSEAAAHCLTDSTSPYYLAGWPQVMVSMMSAAPDVATAMQEGGGVDVSVYGGDLDRMNGPAVTALLTSRWLPVMDDVVRRLETGGRVADVGCGGGAAAVAIAKAFPTADVYGFDIDEESIGRARQLATSEGVQVTFSQVGAEEMPIEPPFDFILRFDVIHDMGDPLGGMRGIRAALADEGAFLMVEPNAGPALKDNLNPLGSLFYSISLLHCLPVSLSNGSVGLGTAWGPVRAEELAAEAGFGSFERLPIENATNAFYRLGA